MARVEELLTRRKELDDLSEDVLWTKEISFKTGIDPSLILELGTAIDQEVFEEFVNLSIIAMVEWFFKWLQKDSSYLFKIYTKASAIIQIKKTLGLRTDVVIDVTEVHKQFPLLITLLKNYVEGSSMKVINDLIPNSAKPDTTPYLIKSRNFIIRLVPELSFGFGLLSMIIIEKAGQKGMQKDQLSWNIRALASCIREGFDNVNKLFYKRNNHILTRVETHIKYKQSQQHKM